MQRFYCVDNLPSALAERTLALLDEAGLEKIADASAAIEAASKPEREVDVLFVAFGFKYGLPLDLDLLFDVRFLRNPNYDDALRPFSGANPAVAAFIEADPALEPFLHKTIDLLDFLLPRYRAGGKARLTIGIGCTGGRHRSIYVARRLYEHYEGREPLHLSLDERDVNR